MRWKSSLSLPSGNSTTALSANIPVRKEKGHQGNHRLISKLPPKTASVPMDGDSIPQTQQKIIDVLHMDYSTFTNSAFLRQGHADEFTTSSPAKRKQVLVNILGLSYYDGFETQAKDIARQREMLRAQLMVSIADIDRELQMKAPAKRNYRRLRLS
jgi:DNA repair exonuclease SbcCD ATPase subunit